MQGAEHIFPIVGIYENRHYVYYKCTLGAKIGERDQRQLEPLPPDMKSMPNLCRYVHGASSRCPLSYDAAKIRKISVRCIMKKQLC